VSHIYWFKFHEILPQTNRLLSDCVVGYRCEGGVGLADPLGYGFPVVQSLAENRSAQNYLAALNDESSTHVTRGHLINSVLHVVSAPLVPLRDVLGGGATLTPIRSFSRFLKPPIRGHCAGRQKSCWHRCVAESESQSATLSWIVLTR